MGVCDVPVIHEVCNAAGDAAGAPGHLRQQLERAFAGAKVRHVQRQIGVNDADERDVGKMQALGDHLRADKNINLTGAKIAKHFAVIVFAFHDVRVHAFDASVGKKFSQDVFDFLRAETGITDGWILAFRIRANGGHAFVVTAQMTAQ